MKGLDSQIKGFLFFAGSLLRWPPKEPRQFLLFHFYILVIYALHSLTGLGFFLVAGALGPMVWAICQGLPLDCLAYEAALEREVSSTSLKK